MKQTYVNQILRNIANNKWWVQALIVGVILFVGTSLRVVQADQFPINNLDDGIYYAWSGVSFWQNPLKVTSFTLFDSDNTRLFWRSQYLDELPSEEFGFRMVEPWFDHPPLGAAFIGLPAYLLGYHAFENIPYGIVRLPAVLASIGTMLFCFFLIKSLFGFKQAALTTLILAVTPYFVFAHRQSYLENILTPVFLLAAWQGYEVISKNSKSKWSWVLAVASAFLCGWIKLIGQVVPLLLSLWGVKNKNWKAATVFFLTLIASIGSYIGYGLIADAEGFLQTISNQGSRGMFWGNAAEIISNQGIAGSFQDTTLLLAWIATFIFIFVSTMGREDKKNPASTYFSWLFAAWLLIIIITTGKFNNFIWYRYPIFPLLSYGLAWFVIQLWQKINLIGAILLVLLGWSQFFVVYPEWLENGGTRILILLALSLPYLLFICLDYFNLLKWPQKTSLFLHRFWLLVICGAIIVTNILVVVQFPDYNCSLQKNCTLPKKIILNE